MSCIGSIGGLLVWLVIVCAGLMILRLIIATIFGMPLWPGRPFTPGAAPSPTPAPAGIGATIVGLILGILDIVFWAVIVCAVIYIAIDLIGCLGGLISPPRLR